jgi:PKD repeat protein
MIDFGDGTLVYDSHATHTYAYQGLYVATCTVTDVDGDRGYDATWINISRNHCPVLATLADQSVQLGNLLTFTVSATDADSDALSYSADAPFSAYFDPIARVLSWTPTLDSQVGNHLATFRVTDGSCEDSQTININVFRGAENHAPDAEFNWTPLTPEVGEDVVFTSTSSDVDGDALTCAWDFNNDGVTDSTDCAAGWVFTTPGNHSVTLTVSDGELSDSITHTITVIGQLNVTNIECLSPVIENTDRQHTWQSCSIDVESNGVPVSGANVVLHYIDGTVIRNCITDSITGACTVTFAPGAPGNYTVYATAEKAGWIPDLDTVPTENFVVLAQRYYISNLDVYNDSAFMNWDVDFFRGENMYVSFMVVDGSGNPIDGMVTSVALVSPPGGIAWFEAFPYASPEAGTYYYVLNIPITHDFLGDSQVFTFAFNFTDGSGAEMVVEVIIRNNPPVIDEAVVGEFSGVFNSTAVINLTPYESDVEDSGADLTWRVLGVNTDVAIVTVDADDQLTVTPVSEGLDIITLVLTDLDGDTDMIDNISINTGVVVPDVTQCNDGIDNDGDNRTDYPDDVGCSGLLDDNESDHPIVPPVLSQCNDGLDNDGDGFVDYPADPGCENAQDDNEVNPAGRGLAISDVWLSASEVEAGRSIAAVVIVANRGIVDEEDVRVTFDIPALGLRALPDYMDVERGRSSVSEELYLRIPITAVVGNYTCVFTARSFDGLVVSTRNETITVLAHSPGTHPQCSDGLDNDGDGLVDYPADPGCENASDNDESNHVPVLHQCNDGIDNDGDNRTDYPDDVGCSGLLDDNESDHPIVPPVLPQCNDGIDNDHDGFTDMNDTDCVTPSDNSEHYLPQCMDGIDNDLDGRIDWPADPHCASSSDPYEDEIWIREGRKVFRDMDDIIVTRIDINGNDIDRAVVEPGNYVRFSVGLQNNLNYDLKDIKVEAAIYELGARDTDVIRSLDVDDSATVVFEMDIPEDAAPGLYDVRVVVSNNDVRRVKYRTLVVA